MPFKYHPPTRKYCGICEKIKGDLKPLIHNSDGKASAAAIFPFHNWYYFVLGYSPEFPNFLLNREKIGTDNFVVDPFMGSGTTLACCKNRWIKSAGVEANDFFKFAAEVKLNWKLNPQLLRDHHRELIKLVIAELSNFKWVGKSGQTKLNDMGKKRKKDPAQYAKKHRPKLLSQRYMGNNVFVKVDIIKKYIEKYNWASIEEKNFFLLGLASILVPVSNVHYGPGFGVGKARVKADVVSVFDKKINRMISDIGSKQNDKTLETPAIVKLGDARLLSNYFDGNSVDIMITSPPYPGDHEYTKHSRIELIFLQMATTIDDFRYIKKRMLRASTTNIYKDDNDKEFIKGIKSIKKLTTKIHKRLRQDNATSGFEKLYVKLIFEYFGGMHRVFKEALKVLKPGGKFCLLVSDSHAFKMVHIQTAEILKEVAKKAGFVNGQIELWQFKNSTSHNYKLLENILTVQKPRTRGLSHILR